MTTYDCLLSLGVSASVPRPDLDPVMSADVRDDCGDTSPPALTVGTTPGRLHYSAAGSLSTDAATR